MTTLYIYDIESKEIIVKYEGQGIAFCESVAISEGYDIFKDDSINWKFDPIGLIETEETQEVII